MKKAEKKVYFDNASTTALDKKVLSAMLPFFDVQYGNPSNLYEMGRRAKEALVFSSNKISAVLSCRPDEFVFTGSATESDNLAIAGVARANKDKGKKIIISSVEHKGIFSICEELKKEGFEIVILPVLKNGMVSLEDLEKEINENTILISITMADSETGTIQPISQISKIIKNLRKGKIYPYLHTDASQAAAYLDINTKKLGVDLMTISAHKMGGPKGIGGLYVRSGVKISPIIFGGGQQGRLRSGTENVPGIVGFGEAVRLNNKNKKTEYERIKKLRNELENGILESIPKVVLNGHKTKRLPNFLNISILDIEGEALLLHLDELGIMINTGSACNSESLTPSYVLTAMGNPYEFVHGSIRFSLGHLNTLSDVKYILKHLPEAVFELRKISPLNLSLGQDTEVSEPKAFINNQTPHFLRKKQNGQKK